MFCEHCGSLIVRGMTVRLDSCDTPMVIWCMNCVERMDEIARERGDVLGLYIPGVADYPSPFHFS